MSGQRPPCAVNEFKEAFRAEQSLRTVCVAPQSAVERILAKDELIAEFGGCITYIDDDAGAEYLGVWGTRNAKRFRAILRARGAELTVNRHRPPNIRLKARTVVTSQRA